MPWSSSFTSFNNPILILSLLLSLFSICSHCTLGVILRDMSSLATLKCIYNAGYKYSVSTVVSTVDGVDGSVMDVLYNVRNSELGIEIVYVPCRGRSPQLEVQDFVKNIPKELYETVWLYASADSPDRMCQWDEQNIQSNILKMIEFVTEFSKSSIKIGFIANQQYWQQMFGGSLLFKDFPLFWQPQIPNNTPSFEDFKGFADWTLPKEKLFSMQGNVCGVGYSLCYEV